MSDENGFYQFPDLAPGVVFGHRGKRRFPKTNRANNIRAGGPDVSVDLKLVVGAVNEVVEGACGVTALIEPEKVSTGVNFDPSLTSRLPLVNRRFSDLASVAPGATFAASGTQGGIGFAPRDRARSRHQLA